MYGSIATNPGALPFLLAKDGLQSPTPAPPTLDASGMPKPGEIQPSTTISAPLTSSSSSGQSEVKESPDFYKKKAEMERTGQASVDALADPVLPGYAVNPLTGAEIGKPDPATLPPPAAPIPADAMVPLGKFGAVRADQMPGVQAVDGGVLSKQDVPPSPTYSLAVQKDANAAAAAEFAAKQATELRAQQDAEEKVRKAAIDDWMGKVKGYEDEYKKARKGVTEPEQKTFFTSFMQSLARGAGAYSAGILGGPNHASTILDNAEKLAFEKKKIELETAAERLKDAGARPAHIQKMYDEGMARFIAKQKTDMAELAAKSNALLAKFPTAQSEAQKMITAAQAKQAAEAATFAKGVGARRVESSTSTPATMQTTVIPGSDKMKDGTSVSEAEGKKANYGDQIVRAAKEIKAGPALTDSDLRRLNQNIMDMAAAAEQGTKSLVGAAKVQGMRALGLSPDSLTDGLPKGKKAVAQAWLNGTGLVIRDQSGAAITIPEDLRNWQIKGPQPGEGPGGYNRKLSNLEYEGNNMLKMAGAEANRRLRGEVGAETKAYDYSKARDNVPTAKPAPTPNLIGREFKNLTKDEIEDYKYAKDNPNDPASSAAIRKLEAKARGGK